MGSCGDDHPFLGRHHHLPAKQIRVGRRATFDFPLDGEIEWAELQERARSSPAQRGDVVNGQAQRALAEFPQLALMRRFSPNLFVMVTDQLVPEYVDRIEPGVEQFGVPTWTLCVISRRPSSWRLEVHSSYVRAQEVATGVAQSLGLRFTLAGPRQVCLLRSQVDTLVDALEGSLVRRRVTTYEDQTGARKVEIEKGADLSDVREGSLYADLEAVIDEADQDLMTIPFAGQTHSLQISRRGSFWFRGHTPRELIDVVLGEAERIVGC